MSESLVGVFILFQGEGIWDDRSHHLHLSLVVSSSTYLLKFVDLAQSIHIFDTSFSFVDSVRSISDIYVVSELSI